MAENLLANHEFDFNQELASNIASWAVGEIIDTIVSEFAPLNVRLIYTAVTGIGGAYIDTARAQIQSINAQNSINQMSEGWGLGNTIWRFNLTTVIVHDNQGNIRPINMPSTDTVPILEAWNEFFNLGGHAYERL